MSDSNYYNQCYWHADGSLNCKRQKLTYDPEKYKQYAEFNDFSTPNANYKPNAYKDNISYYEQPYRYNSGVSRDIPENNYSIDNKWLATPQTKSRTDFFK